MSTVAIVSDIHANLEACTAVLEHIRSQGIREIICLGDVIGYGPNPRECLELAYDFEFCLMGNHEEAVLFYAEDFNEKARRAIEWTKERLNSGEYDKERNFRLWNFLDGMERSRVRAGVLMVHGSPRNPTKEYLLPQDVRSPEKLQSVFSTMKQDLCFCGHSHVPGVFTEDLEYRAVHKDTGEFEPDGRKTIVNIGSVGQPRDGDVRACYVTYDGTRVRYFRVEYDYRKTMEKIRKIDSLPGFLADRLARGR